MNKSKQSGRFALSCVAMAALMLGATQAWAVGLGRLSVQSNLGETLRAEIDVTSLTPEEAANLKIRVAAPDVYRAAGVDYSAVLPGTQISLLRHADGRPYLRLFSDRVVQEPFVDVILELSWSTGRLVREYTLLFDPVVDRAPAPVPQTAPVFTAPVPATPAVPVAPATPTAPAAPAPSASRDSAAAPKAARQEAASKPAAASSAASAPESGYRVRSGDTLTGIASRQRTADVSLDQMLVALYRGNPQAFAGDNINRLKSGVVLALPSADTVAAIDSSEARRFIVAQSADFGSFRQKLAAAVPEVRSDASARKDAGKVQARVDDSKAGSATLPDKLTLSKAASAPGAAVPEARISAEREKQDAAARVAELSRNVEELKKLSGAAGLGAQAPAAASAPNVTPSQPAPAIEVPVAAALPPAASVPDAASQPESPPTAASQAASAAPKPPKSAASAASVPAIAVEEEPGFLGELLENNLTSLIAGGVALLALIGLVVFRSRRPSAEAGESSFLESRLQPDSFFGSSGGQRIDTREAAGVAGSSSMSYSLSQLDAIGDVDPVQEADVYLAYGRDLQAEEILKEAMRSAPERMAIRTKLLEVYAKRRDTKGFELLALQLYPLTGGAGDDWAKAQELGLEIDPENPLYQEGGAPPTNLPDAADLGRDALDVTTMPQTVQPSPSAFADSRAERTETLNPQAVTDVREQPLDYGDVDLHLDLDLDELASQASEPTAPLSFQFEDTSAPETPPEALSVDDFDVDLTSAEPASDTGSDAKHVDPVASNPFALPDLELTPSPAPSVARPMEFDLSAISLDLDDGSVSSTAEPAAESPSMADGDDADDEAGDPLARKLELAEEFRQIGDIEGARDLLQEVVADASGTLKTRAEALLKDLA